MEKLPEMMISERGEIEVEKQSDLKENKRNLMEKLAGLELQLQRNERLHLLKGVAVESRWREERDMWKERAEQLRKENSRLVSLMSPPQQHSTPRHHSDSGHSLDLTEIPLRVHVNNLEDSTEEDGSELKCSLSRESPSCLTGPSMLTSQAENRSDLKVVQLQLLDNNNIMENPEVFDETELKMGAELPALRLLGMECLLSDWRGSSSLVRVRVRAVDRAGSAGLFSSAREMKVA